MCRCPCNYQACHGNSLPAETIIRTAGPDGNPFFDISWLAVEEVDQQVYKFKFDLQPGSLTDQVAGEHQPSDKHP